SIADGRSGSIPRGRNSMISTSTTPKMISCSSDACVAEMLRTFCRICGTTVTTTAPTTGPSGRPRPPMISIATIRMPWVKPNEVGFATASMNTSSPPDSPANPAATTNAATFAGTVQPDRPCRDLVLADRAEQDAKAGLAEHLDQAVGERKDHDQHRQQRGDRAQGDPDAQRGEAD